MNPVKIIQKYYEPKSEAYYFLVEHSKMVAKKALEIGKRVAPQHLKPDLKFIEEAAMLHDIGIFLTNAPEIGCHGKAPYICHGFLGREILDKEGLPRHGLVCERHLGVGITRREIEENNLPLPRRDMAPISLEEKIVCFADNFFSKNKEFLHREESIDKIKKDLARFGQDKVNKFEEWLELFTPTPMP